MKGAQGWQLSNSPVFAMAPCKASLDIFDEVGMSRLVSKSKRLTNYMEFIFNDISSRYDNCDLEIITPKDEKYRGCQLSVLCHGQGKSLFYFLSKKGVIADWREPNVIRLAPVPLYNSFEDISVRSNYRRRIIMRKKVTIAGAGLVGSLEAIYLAKRGFEVEVYERRPDMRKVELSAGRSINLALSTRGWNALKTVGLDQDVEKMAIPMYKRVMHAVDGSLTDQQYGQDGEAIYSVSRGGLNQLLMNLAGEQDNVNMHFNYKCIDVDLKSASATFEHKDGNQKNVDADMIIGADGAYSVIRSKMIKQDRFQYSQHYIEHGYKELTIPANSDGTHKLEVNALHIWPRGSYMLIALPNMDGSFTCTLFFPYEGEYSFNSLQTEQQVYDFFKKSIS